MAGGLDGVNKDTLTMQSYRNRKSGDWAKLGYTAARLGQSFEEHKTGNALADKWIMQGFTRFARKSPDVKKTQRSVFVLRITLPPAVVDEEYIDNIRQAVEDLNPDIKGQRVTVQYQGEDR